MLELNVCKTLFIRKEQILVERVGYEIVVGPQPLGLFMTQVLSKSSEWIL